MQLELRYQLPQELEDLIIQYLSHDLVSLRASSLVCHRFTYTSRKYLFNTIVLNFSTYGDPQSAPARFMELLISSPYICDFVRNLSVVDSRYKIGGPTHLRFDTILPICLPLLQGLRSIAVESNALTSLMWTAMSQDVQLALEETFRSPSLISISFYRMLDLPLALLSRPPSLQNLSLRLVTFRKEDMGKERENCAHDVGSTQETRKPPRLTSLLLMLSDPIFNFFATWITSQESLLDISGIRRLSVTMTMEYYDHGNVRMLLDAIASSLEIFCFSPVFGGSSNSVAINPIDVGNLHSLRILRLRLGMIQVIFNRAPIDFSPWVLKIVSQLKSKDLQEISLKIDLIHHIFQGRIELGTSNWSGLDSLLAETCPSLRTFTIYILDDEADINEKVELCLRNQLVGLVERGVLNIEVATSRTGFLASETSSVSPSSDIA